MTTTPRRPRTPTVPPVLKTRRVPRRLKILYALTEFLEGINPDNGYDDDLRGKVYRGKVLFGPKNKVPFLSILEAPIQDEGLPTNGDHTQAYSPWELVIQGYAKDDGDHPTDEGHFLMAAVKKRLIEQNLPQHIYRKLGIGAVVEVHIGQGVVRPGDTPSENAFFWLTVTLKVIDNLLDPYS